MQFKDVFLTLNFYIFFVKNPLYSRYLTYFLVVQILFIQFVSRYPEKIEHYYSRGFYPFIANFYRVIFGWIPFSIGDFIYALLLLLIFRFIYVMIRDKFSELRNYFFATGAAISIIYFIFHLNWGLNYYRTTLSTQLKIESNSYDTKKLISYTKKIIYKTNDLHISLTGDKALKTNIPYTQKEIHKLAVNGYTNLNKIHPFLVSKNNSIKRSLWSPILNYTGFSGYLNPFTAEAQINYNIPLNSYISTTCHEIAHQLGYAAENEANFIGYLASIHNDDPYFKYAGQLDVLRRLLSEIYREDKKQFKKIKSMINPGVSKNLQELSEYWKQYKNPIEPLLKKCYDGYLKINKQKNGIQSYHNMIGLLLNYK